MKSKAPGKLKENEGKVTKQWKGQSTERAGGSFDICEDLHTEAFALVGLSAVARPGCGLSHLFPYFVEAGARCRRIG